MLKLKDFFHLPQLDPLIEQMITEHPELIVVAGLDPQPVTGEWIAGETFLPSGRPAIFNILVQELLTAYPEERGVILSRHKNAFRIPRQLKHRTGLVEIEPPMRYADRAAQAMAARPDLLVIDHLDPESVPVVRNALERHIRVITQIDTLTWGAGVVREINDLGLGSTPKEKALWVITVKRLRKLCSTCKIPIAQDEIVIERLRERYPSLYATDEESAGSSQARRFFQAGTCTTCQGTGRSGDIAVFDIYRSAPDLRGPSGKPSLFSLEMYVFDLANEGILALDDLMWLETDHLRRTYHLLADSKRANVDADAALLRKVVELEAANRVLRNRTEVLLSLQDLDQALTASVSLDDLAPLVCREVSNLCGADRVVLYFRKDQTDVSHTAEILAVNGWASNLVHSQVEASLVFNRDGEAEPSPYSALPPGITDPPVGPHGERILLKTGMRVPLLVQGKQVGVMIVHSTKKKYFTPGETTLLQTYANQAAVAIQRAGLFEELRAKIAQLEAAQAELVKKERMEREIELAREVQQSMLPRTFPAVEGFTFAAWNEPARQVGGDFFDVIALDDDHFGIAIADVSDKGMAAALFMALSRSLLVAEAQRELSPRKVLANINRLLFMLGETRQFVSVFYGVVEKSTRRLTYTRGGHESPFLIRKEKIIPLSGKGTVLGIMEPSELDLSEEQVDLLPGDRLVLYTDGLTDVVDSAGEFFGRERLMASVQASAHFTPVQMCAAVSADLAAYQGNAEQFDDMTIFVVDVE